MSFCCFQYFQKTSGNMQHKYYDISGPIVFVRLYEEFKTPKRHFGINWPLDSYIYVGLKTKLLRSPEIS